MKKNNFRKNKAMKKNIFAFIAFLMATTTSAQILTPQQEREFFQNAYAKIQEYVQTATVDNEERQDRFRHLFTGQNVEVYNDLMGLSYAPLLTVDDYIAVLGKARTVSVEVRNIRKGQISDNGDSWQMPLLFDKAISFDNECGTHFDSKEFFEGKYYRLQAVIVKEKSTDRYSITAIKAVENGGLDFPEDYIVLMKNDDRDINLEVNGRQANFNIYEQILLRPNPSITYFKGKVEQLPYSGDGMPCDNKIIVDYADKSWRLRLGGGCSLGDFNKIDGMAYGKIEKNTEYGFGLDVGYVFPSKSHLFVGVFAGVGMSFGKLEVNAPAGTYTSETKQKDVDGDDYIRGYELEGDGMSQTIESTDFSVPVYLDLEYKIASSFSLYGDLGIKAYFKMGEPKYKGTIGTYKTFGTYENYGGLTIDSDIPILGFGSQAPSKDIKIDESNGISKESFALDALIGAGLRFNITKSFAFDAGVQCQLGLTDSWKSTTSNRDLGHFDNGEEQFYSLLRGSGSVKHQALRVFASLIYKF